jgi:hypothetical protein
VGYLSNPSNPAVTLNSENPNQSNAVQVSVRKTLASANGSVPFFFARVLGLTHQDMQVSATAALINNIGGFQSPTNGGNIQILPFALDKQTWDDMLAGGGTDNWKWDPVSKTVSSGSDGVHEINLYPQGTGAPGNRGFGGPGGLGGVLHVGRVLAPELIRRRPSVQTEVCRAVQDAHPTGVGDGPQIFARYAEQVGVVRHLARHDDMHIAAPILTQSERLTEADLIEIAKTKSQGHLSAISERAVLNEPVTDALLTRGNQKVFHKLAQNPGASFSKSGFATIVKHAEGDDDLAEKVGRRAPCIALHSAASPGSTRTADVRRGRSTRRE